MDPTTTAVEQPVLIDTTAAAERLGVSFIWLKRQTAAGRVQCTRVGRLVRFSPADLEAFVEQRRQLPVNRRSA